MPCNSHSEHDSKLNQHDFDLRAGKVEHWAHVAFEVQPRREARFADTLATASPPRLPEPSHFGRKLEQVRDLDIAKGQPANQTFRM